MNHYTKHQPQTISDRIAKQFTMMLRWTADTFFLKQYGHRAVVLETVIIFMLAFIAVVLA